MSENLKALTEQGVAIWLDDISRERLRTGNLEALIRDKAVTGITSNPTIFASALSKGDAYDVQLHDLMTRGVDLGEATRAITTYDIRWAADVLRPVYDVTGGVEGRVSIEVDPRLSKSTDKTIAEARALWWLVDRPNLFIKIPATVEGLPAISQALSEGISVNVTLIFSLARYRAVMDAWLEGLERAKANGVDLSSIESVASFFVSRVDTEVDKRLDAIGTPEALALKGKAAVANARLAYEAYEEVVNGPRWQALKAAGAHPQRPLWASTGVKNPDYSDTMYVDQLVTPGTVNTMPEKTLDAVADHGKIDGDTVRPYYEQAWETMAALKQAGIDYDDVVQALEDEGVEKFVASWNELLGTVEAELKKVD
ncbi:transaldolase [Sphaerisporangium sp. TRM90804]|uniref:transaldolase n=1 Tax=Sphaerisporangium sp. TRM90804 TaxID=3031113 RepID=UPI00244BFF4D|nr:transaldolase [Sphaerisporangium sp. TRM90804]MDH2430261.1 transaldolase [Sphaerisporangium sp. TRM90804]